MRDDVEKTQGGHSCELLQPLHYHLAVTNAPFRATDENIETICNEGGVRADKCCHRCEVFQGRQEDEFIQGRPERPRNTPEVQHGRTSAKPSDCCARQKDRIKTLRNDRHRDIPLRHSSSQRHSNSQYHSDPHSSLTVLLMHTGSTPVLERKAHYAAG